MNRPPAALSVTSPPPDCTAGALPPPVVTSPLVRVFTVTAAGPWMVSPEVVTRTLPEALVSTTSPEAPVT